MLISKSVPAPYEPRSFFEPQLKFQTTSPNRNSFACPGTIVDRGSLITVVQSQPSSSDLEELIALYHALSVL